MVRRTFIPNWYIDKKIQSKNKKQKIYIILISIINIVLLSFMLSNSKKIKNTVEQVGNENNNSIVEMVKPDVTAIEKYKEFSSFFEANNVSYKNMVITRGNLEVNIEVKSYEEYIHVIKCIENSYSIKRLDPDNESKENFNFIVIFEV